VVSISLRPLYPRYTFSRRLCGPHWVWTFGEEINILKLSGLEQNPPALSLVPAHTALFWFPGRLWDSKVCYLLDKNLPLGHTVSQIVHSVTSQCISLTSIFNIVLPQERTFQSSFFLSEFPTHVSCEFVKVGVSPSTAVLRTFGGIWVHSVQWQLFVCIVGEGIYWAPGRSFSLSSFTIPSD
jgi:hypothetical protein